jgi:hypothetical protein
MIKMKRIFNLLQHAVSLPPFFLPDNVLKRSDSWRVCKVIASRISV